MRASTGDTQPVEQLILKTGHNPRAHRTAISMLLIDNVRVMQLSPALKPSSHEYRGPTN